MLVQILLIVLGLILLIKGADWLVTGASDLARKFNMSELAIGLTIVAFGTSAPEMVVNSIASAQGHQHIVFGNILGSNNFNIFIILGITGLITPPVVQSSTVWKEIPISFIAAVLVFLFCNSFISGNLLLTRAEGAILLLMFVLFLLYVYKQLKGDPVKLENSTKESSSIKLYSLIIMGLLALVFGGRLVVTQAVDIATTLGISEKIIGLTIVAAGTSLPELATSVVAAFKKNSDIAVGNIIGSNIFNLLFILAASSLIRPIEFDVSFNFDIYLLFGGTAILFIAMFSGQKKKLDRWEAALLLVIYLLYLGYMIKGEF